MTKRAKVGMRLSWDEIVADPQATAVQIRALAQDHPLLALAHPNCPPALWWDLAAEYPIEAQASVAYDLMTLETPEAWGEMERANIEAWVQAYVTRLSHEAKLLLAADCVAHVLPIFTAYYSADKRPATAIALTRAMARGTATATERNSAKLAMQGGYHAMMTSRAPSSVQYAYDAAQALLDNESASTVCVNAANNAHYAAAYHASPNSVPAKFAEQQWQWERLQQYLRKEAK